MIILEGYSGLGKSIAYRDLIKLIEYVRKILGKADIPKPLVRHIDCSTQLKGQLSLDLFIFPRYSINFLDEPDHIAQERGREIYSKATNLIMASIDSASPPCVVVLVTNQAKNLDPALKFEAGRADYIFVDWENFPYHLVADLKSLLYDNFKSLLYNILDKKEKANSILSKMNKKRKRQFSELTIKKLYRMLLASERVGNLRSFFKALNKVIEIDDITTIIYESIKELKEYIKDKKYKVLEEVLFHLENFIKKYEGKKMDVFDVLQEEDLEISSSILAALIFSSAVFPSRKDVMKWRKERDEYIKRSYLFKKELLKKHLNFILKCAPRVAQRD